MHAAAESEMEFIPTPDLFLRFGTEFQSRHGKEVAKSKSWCSFSVQIQNSDKSQSTEHECNQV